ncbi:MAG: hypothetical protein DWI07_00040 [Planctomycetota bacterium]|nr:MAG: hypothetical protein DWI07_00040 [Planctomycetota bacterium]
MFLFNTSVGESRTLSSGMCLSLRMEGDDIINGTILGFDGKYHQRILNLLGSEQSHLILCPQAFIGRVLKRRFVSLRLFRKTDVV